MKGLIFYNAGITNATGYAAKFLKASGITFTNQAANATHIMVDTPCKENTIPEDLPAGTTVIGGNLPQMLHPAIDLLQDPLYLTENANITAHCAVRLALEQLPVILSGCQVLVVGWGRIGKCLARLLQQMGAIVCVAARKDSDRALLTALGYNAKDIFNIPYQDIRIVFNTVPEPILKAEDFSSDCLKLELASTPGIIGENVTDGRRLPGRYAPESSGALIARSVLRLLPEVIT